MRKLCFDGGTEYSQLNVSLHNTTTLDTPQNNPYAEHFSRNYIDSVRTIFAQYLLSGKYWEWPMMHVVYIKNRMKQKSIDCTPYETFTGLKLI